MTSLSAFRYPAALVLALGLSGCVGGSDTYEAALSNASAKSAVRGPKYDIAGFDVLAGEFTETDRYFYMFPPAEGHSVPISGSATYNGIAAFGDNAQLGSINAGDPEMLADMALTVNFGTARVTGTMWGFRAKDGKVGDGSVTLRGLQNSTTFTANGSSTIYWGDVDQDITVNIDGYFLANERGIKGTMANTLEGTGNVDIQQAGVIILKRDTE